MFWYNIIELYLTLNILAFEIRLQHFRFLQHSKNHIIKCYLSYIIKTLMVFIEPLQQSVSYYDILFVIINFNPHFKTMLQNCCQYTFAYSWLLKVHLYTFLMRVISLTTGKVVADLLIAMEGTEYNFPIMWRYLNLIKTRGELHSK